MKNILNSLVDWIWIERFFWAWVYADRSGENCKSCNICIIGILEWEEEIEEILKQ